MSDIFSACLRGNLEARTYAKALVDRRVPFHVRDEGGRPDEKRLRAEVARDFACREDDILIAPVESHFIKGILPTLVGRDRRTGERTLLPPGTGGSMNVPVRHKRTHVFIDRDIAETGRGAKNA